MYRKWNHTYLLILHNKRREQTYLTVTHQNYLDYKKLLESKESMGGKISDDEANVLDKLREKYLTAKNGLFEFEQQNW